MSLTSNDLKAIKTIVEDASDDVKIQTAAGFAEVHQKIDNLTSEVEDVKADVKVLKSDVNVLKLDVKVLKSDVEDLKNTVGRIENVQRAEVSRADKYGSAIAKLKKHLA